MAYPTFGLYGLRDYQQGAQKVFERIEKRYPYGGDNLDEALNLAEDKKVPEVWNFETPELFTFNRVTKAVEQEHITNYFFLQSNERTEEVKAMYASVKKPAIDKYKE